MRVTPIFGAVGRVCRINYLPVGEAALLEGNQMLKYQCDFIGLKERCENPAVVARDFNGKYGAERVHFCQEHSFVLASGYVAEYAIRDDELVETGISKHNRELRVVQRPNPFTVVGIDAADRALLRRMKVSWDDGISEQDRSLLKEMRIVWYVEDRTSARNER